jgi:hypothetical protein
MGVETPVIIAESGEPPAGSGHRAIPVRIATTAPVVEPRSPFFQRKSSRNPRDASTRATIWNWPCLEGVE